MRYALRLTADGVVLSAGAIREYSANPILIGLLTGFARLVYHVASGGGEGEILPATITT